MPSDAKATPPLCTRCKEHDGLFDLRSDAVCETCFVTFVASKAIKRLEVLQRETRGPRLPSRPQRYLLALSRGPSSTALLHILSENLRRQRERNQRVKFELVVVFVEVDIDVAGNGGGDGERRTAAATTSVGASSVSSNGHADTATATATATTSTDAPSTTKGPSPFLPTDPFQAHFPDLAIHKVPLSSILSSPVIDWTSLPARSSGDGDGDGDGDESFLPSGPQQQQQQQRRLASLLAALPSASARADTGRLLTRHALFAAARAHACDVVLLGYNTTALAELTLCEAAKGRGFGIAWLVNDGAFPLPSSLSKTDGNNENENENADVDVNVNADADGTATTTTNPTIQIYSPLREIFRKEILTYLAMARSPTGPRLSDLFPSSSPFNGAGAGAAAVVSHRDLSLDDVVSRFFVDVEASYPSVVANVVRTTGKLNRVVAGGCGDGTEGPQQQQQQQQKQCGLCAVRLDPFGDDRWKGEIGELDIMHESRGGGSGSKGRSGLCYGCERSVRG